MSEGFGTLCLTLNDLLDAFDQSPDGTLPYQVIFDTIHPPADRLSTALDALPALSRAQIKDAMSERE